MSNDHIEVRLGGSQVRGFVSEQGLANFLGIPFATVPDRFRPARSLEYAENAADAPAAASTIDATKYGPRCSQADDEFGGAKEIFFQGLHAASTEPDSDRDCLRLNVYTPPEAVGAGDDARLPVIVWIHGGGAYTTNVLASSGFNVISTYLAEIRTE
ncbi:hypothetical protein SBRCBS47491_006589 [Sporothrix bragantina]|uniref:Carboxylesterase type B domain-containing protein n=1 Tax=Sporothrix bragantina TaxID=671064 RepID=A0ABP0C658_9PEZI